MGTDPPLVLDGFGLSLGWGFLCLHTYQKANWCTGHLISLFTKSVPGMKEGKSVTGSRDSKGSAGVRRDKWWDQWPEGNSAATKGWSLFLCFEMSSLFLFSPLFFAPFINSMFFHSPVLWFFYFVLSFPLGFWPPCFRALFNISCMETTTMFNQEVVSMMVASKCSWDKRNYPSIPGKIQKLQRRLKNIN